MYKKKSIFEHFEYQVFISHFYHRKFSLQKNMSKITIWVNT